MSKSGEQQTGDNWHVQPKKQSPKPKLQATSQLVYTAQPLGAQELTASRSSGTGGEMQEARDSYPKAAGAFWELYASRKQLCSLLESGYSLARGFSPGK